jgi:hypothetical protein
MASLEEALLRGTKLTRADLARAAGRRAEMGGHLETALLELGLTNERELAPILAGHYGLPAATADDLRDIPDGVRRLLSRDQAGSYQAVPFAAAPGRVDLAVTAALDIERGDELAFLLGRRVRLFVVNEVRMAQALQRLYGLNQPARLLNLADRLERGLGPSRDLASEPAHSPVLPAGPAGTFGAFGAGAGSPRPAATEHHRRVTPTKPREELRTITLSEDERRAIFGAPAEPLATPAQTQPRAASSDLARLSSELQAAASPTAVGDAFLAYIGPLFGVSLLLRPEGELFRGWLGHGTSFDRDRLRQLITGPGLAGEWRNELRDVDSLRWPVGPSAAAIDLHEALGIEVGGSALLIPVRVQGRIVCLAICASSDKPKASEKERLANAILRVGLALQSWILRQKTLSNTKP